MPFKPFKLHAIESILNQCHIGREAVAYRQVNRVPVGFNAKPGGDWSARLRRIRLNDSVSNDQAALILVHEINHAKYHIEGWVPDPKKVSEAQYVAARIEEE